MNAKPMSADRPANIHDVAALCGVAPSTVSRALTNPGRISAATRERIQAAATQLGYVPSRQARALSSGRTGTIAVLVPDISHPGYSALLKSTYFELKSAGYAQLLIDTEADADVEGIMLEQLRKGSDGAIVVESLLSDSDLLTAASRQPLVAINRDLSGVPAALIDPAPAIGTALDHLLGLGHSRVAYVTSARAPGHNANAEHAAVLAAATERSLDITVLGPFPPTADAGPIAADAVLQAGATASFASSSMLALGMLKRFRETGTSVPDAMSLIGCEDISEAHFCTPSLTTLRPPLAEAGKRAAAMLVEMIAGSPGEVPDLTRISLPSVLALRATTGAGGIQVAHGIQDHAGKSG